MSRPKLPSEMHPDYPKGESWVDPETGMNCYKPAHPDRFVAFYKAHPEFDNEGDYVFRCPYCGDEIGCEPTDMCCGEVHGEWVLEGPDGEPMEES